MRNLPIKLKVFLYFLYSLTILATYYYGINGFINPVIHDIDVVLFFTVLMVLTESFAVYYKDLSFSTSFAVLIAVYLLEWAFVTILVQMAGYTFRVLKVDDEYYHILNTPKYIVFFNYTLMFIPNLLANRLYVSLGGEFGGTAILDNLKPIAAFGFVIFLLNVIIVGTFFSLREKENSIIYCIISNIKLGALNFIAMAPLGILTAYIFKLSGYFGLALFVFPIVLARFTFSQYIEAKTKYIQTVDVIMNAMEARDRYTQGHSKRVGEISSEIARELKFNEWKIEELKIAALLHDVGKIGIDDSILNKPDKLTLEEFNMIKEHPEIGYKILKDIKDIDKVLSIVRSHHERYDGKGYPDGKNHEDLSLEVFIVQLADSVDAMETDRPYRIAMNKEEVIGEVIRCKGTQFHPEVVDAYLRFIEKKKIQSEV